jgi:hypothetical protein
MSSQELEKLVRLIIRETTEANAKQLQSIADQFTKLESAVAEVKLSILDLKLSDKISFNLRDAANIIGLSYESVYAKVKAGKIKSVQPTGQHGSLLILREDLFAFLNNRKEEDDFLIPEKIMRRVKKRRYE